MGASEPAKVGGAAIEVDGRPPRATVLVYRLNDLGGAEGSTVLFLQHLARSEFQTRVLALTGECGFATRAELESLGMVFIEVRGRWPKRVLVGIRDLVRHPPDIVHSTLFGSDFVGRLGAPLAGAPAMVSVVNMQYSAEAVEVAPSPGRLRIVQEVDRFLSKHLTSAFHALTAAGARYAVSALSADPTRVVVVGRGRELSRFAVDPAEGRALRASLGIPDGAPVLVNLARHEPQKGQALLIEAVAAVRDRHPDVVLLIAGREGNSTPELREAIERFGLGDRVRLLGRRDDIPALLSAATVMVSSARYEGFGGAVLEAMASSTPVVGFDIAPVREVLRGSGRLVPLGDAAALAEATCAVIEDPQLQASMGATGRAVAEQRFSADASAEKLLGLYRQVVLDPERFTRPRITRAVRRLRRR